MGVGRRLKELNPKIGLQWAVTAATQIRLAHFETVKRSLLVNQTIEPTQVAGFNQFFDETNGTHAKLSGLGIDSTLAKGLYGGLEGTGRTAVVPRFTSSTVVDFAEDKQKNYRGYLYWAAAKNWAVSAETQFESIENKAHTGPMMIDTVTLPIGLRYFSDSGFFGKLVVTYVRQEVELSPVESGKENFTLVDAGVGYRLPRRYGTVGVEIRNLFDRRFSYQDQNFMSSEPINPPYLPERQLFLRIGLNF